MLRILFSYFFILIYFTSDAQLISESKNDSKMFFNQKSVLYFGVDVLHSFRELNPNVDYLNNELGERANEIPRWMSGYSLRIAMPVLKFLKINGGIAFQQNGESYEWTSSVSDSSFSYQTSFRYIAMPIQLVVEYGNKLCFYGAFGMSPAIFNSYNQKRQWTTGMGSSSSEETNIQDDCNSFILSFQGDLGVHYAINDFIGIQLTGQYRKQLNNTYKEFEDYIHKASALGFNFAISYQF